MTRHPHCVAAKHSVGLEELWSSIADHRTTNHACIIRWPSWRWPASFQLDGRAAKTMVAAAAPLMPAGRQSWTAPRLPSPRSFSDRRAAGRPLIIRPRKLIIYAWLQASLATDPSTSTASAARGHHHELWAVGGPGWTAREVNRLRAAVQGPTGRFSATQQLCDWKRWTLELGMLHHVYILKIGSRGCLNSRVRDRVCEMASEIIGADQQLEATDRAPRTERFILTKGSRTSVCRYRQASALGLISPARLPIYLRRLTFWRLLATPLFTSSHSWRNPHRYFDANHLLPHQRSSRPKLSFIAWLTLNVLKLSRLSQFCCRRPSWHIQIGKNRKCC